MNRPESPQPDWMRQLAATLGTLDAEGLKRKRRPLAGRSGPGRTLDDQPVLSFASNDYLGLAGEPRLAQALAQAATRYGVGAGSAQLLGGYSVAHEALEADLADWVGRESAVLFSTGYMANAGLISALAERHDRVIQDKRNHASLLDGARLSGARLVRYRHADPQALGERLAQTGGRALVVTESVFSMDGDRAPLAALAVACRSGQTLLCVDEAHALGVLGPQGAGGLAEAGLSADEAPVITGTLGKALGTFGAFVAGPRVLTEWLASRARSHVYTTAPPPALAAATTEALRLCRAEPERRQRLFERIRQFRDGAAARAIPVTDSTTPIQPVPVGDSRAALRLSAALEQRGIWVPAIRPPTVPAGAARLRISLTAAHTEQHVDTLLDALGASL